LSKALSIQAAKRPDGCAADKRRWVVKQSLGLSRECRLPGIADRNQHIANEAVAADALDR